MNRPTTTASNLFRRALCPGSARLEAGLPEEDSEMSREGQLLHDFSAHPEYERSVLKPNQQDLLALNDSLVKEVLVPIRALRKEQVEGHLTREVELQNDLISGHPDLIVGFPKDAAVLINDSKFGYQIVERAELNLQLRSYAVLVYDFLDKTPTDVFVSITQPRLSVSERITVAHYVTTEEQIEDSRQQIKSILAASEKSDAPLVPGEEQCRNCKAKMICSAYQSAMQVPAVITPDNALSKAAREAFLAQRLAECSDEQLEKVHLAEALGRMIREPLRTEERKRIEAGGYQNFKLGKETEVRGISNVRRALALLNLSGMTKDDIYDCVEGVSLSKLGDKLRKSHATWTWKQVNDWINFKLSSVIETEIRKPRVIKK